MSLLLVTGGGGFIGSHVVDSALAAGLRVRVLDSFRPDVHAPDAAGFGRPGVDVLVGDVTDAAAVSEALDGVTIVCHQAAKVGLGVGFSDAPDYVHSNETGTAVLLAGMAARGIGRLVLASSMVIYGEGRYRDSAGPARPAPRRAEDLERGLFEPRSETTGEPLAPVLVDEEDGPDPRNVYAATKVAQENLARAWAIATGGRAAFLRYHNVYGPRMPSNTPYAGVASLFRSAIARGEAPRVFEDGGQRRDFVHVEDVAAANLAAVEWTGAQEAGATRAFNVGSGAVHTVGELAAALSQASGGPEPVVTGEYRLGDVRHITASSLRLRTELGWRPRWGFEEGMRQFASAELRAPAGSAPEAKRPARPRVGT